PAVECSERLRATLETTFGQGGRGLEVDPCRDDVHQHVRAGARPELTGPRGPLVRWRVEPGGTVAFEIVGERLDPDLDLAATAVHPVHEVGQARGGDGVVGA